MKLHYVVKKLPAYVLFAIFCIPADVNAMVNRRDAALNQLTILTEIVNMANPGPLEMSNIPNLAAAIENILGLHVLERLVLNREIPTDDSRRFVAANQWVFPAYSDLWKYKDQVEQVLNRSLQQGDVTPGRKALADWIVDHRAFLKRNQPLQPSQVQTAPTAAYKLPKDVTQAMKKGFDARLGARIKDIRLKEGTQPPQTTKSLAGQPYVGVRPHPIAPPPAPAPAPAAFRVSPPAAPAPAPTAHVATTVQPTPEEIREYQEAKEALEWQQDLTHASLPPAVYQLLSDKVKTFERKWPTWTPTPPAALPLPTPEQISEYLRAKEALLWQQDLTHASISAEAHQRLSGIVQAFERNWPQIKQIDLEEIREYLEAKEELLDIEGLPPRLIREAYNTVQAFERKFNID